MAIRIESLRVENLRRFKGEYQLDFDTAGGPDIVVGSNGSGKTTLVDSIRLCLTGEMDCRPHLAPLELVNQLSTGDEASGEVEVTIWDTTTDSRYRFTRSFQTMETRRGPVDSVGSLSVVQNEGNQWIGIDASTAIDTVFPTASIPFTILDTETTLGIEDQWSGMGFDELVDLIEDAATAQAVARDESVPSYLETNERLVETLLARINDLCPKKLEPYTVEKEDGSLVVIKDGDMSWSMPAAEKTLLSNSVAVAAAQLLPATPPLIGDSIFSRLSLQDRQDLQNLILHQSDQQILLFGVQPEFEGIELTSTYRLEHVDSTKTRIIEQG